MRNGMDVLQFSPFLNSSIDEMERSFAAIRRVIDTVECFTGELGRNDLRFVA